MHMWPWLAHKTTSIRRHELVARHLFGKELTPATLGGLLVAQALHVVSRTFHEHLMGQIRLVLQTPLDHLSPLRPSKKTGWMIV